MSYLSRNNHLEGNIYKCSMLPMLSHLICNFLIVLKTFFGCPWSRMWWRWFGWCTAWFWTRIVIRWNWTLIFCCLEIFFFPKSIIFTQLVLQSILSRVYHFHHFCSVKPVIIVRVKSTSHGTIGFYHFCICWIIIQIYNM